MFNKICVITAFIILSLCSAPVVVNAIWDNHVVIPMEDYMVAISEVNEYIHTDDPKAASFIVPKGEEGETYRKLKKFTTQGLKEHLIKLYNEQLSSKALENDGLPEDGIGGREYSLPGDKQTISGFVLCE